MRTRTTLSLAVVAASFVTYILFVERHTLSTQEKADTAARVINIEPGKITSIFIQNAGSPIELHKKDGVWRLKHPIEDRADDLVVSQLLSTLESLQHNSKIDVPAAQEKDRLKEFGVADSELRIKVRTESGKEAELLLGKDSAIEGKQHKVMSRQHIDSNQKHWRVNSAAMSGRFLFGSQRVALLCFCVRTT